VSGRDDIAEQVEHSEVVADRNLGECVRVGITLEPDRGPVAIEDGACSVEHSSLLTACRNPEEREWRWQRPAVESVNVEVVTLHGFGSERDLDNGDASLATPLESQLRSGLRVGLDEKSCEGWANRRSRRLWRPSPAPTSTTTASGWMYDR
jgi:hypothetical protein